MSQYITQWVTDFSSTHFSKLLHKNSINVVVACSAGVDSMVLAKICKDSPLFSLKKIVYVDHGLRNDTNKDKRIIKQFCELNNIEYHFEKIDITKSGNFEEEARKLRYNKLLSHLTINTYLATAHHLDDSFEWYHFQNFKRSFGKNYAIPILNGRIIRPLHCLSKDQILKFAKIARIDFHKDHTNENLDLERNYFRKKILPPIKNRYPNYLKHFANRMNQVCIKEGNHICISSTSKTNVIWKKEYVVLYKDDYSNDYSSDLSIIFEILTKLSSNKRGSLHKQIYSLIDATKRGKYGPISFSGSVHAHIFKGIILFSKKKTLDISNVLVQKLDTNCDYARKVMKSSCFPYVVGVKKGVKSKSFINKKIIDNYLNIQNIDDFDYIPIKYTNDFVRKFHISSIYILRLS